MAKRTERTPIPRRLSWALGLLLMTSMLVLAPDATAAGSGTLLWAGRYDGPEHTYDSASAIVASPDGTKVFLTGESGGGSADYATIALDASTGARLWARTYDGPVDGLDQASDIAVGPGGSRVFVTGYSDARHGLGSATIAYDASTGSTLWSRRHRGGSRALTVSPDGSEVFVVGFAPDATGSADDYATFAYDAGTGATLWARRYNGAALDGFATAVMATSETVFVTGSSTASGASDFTTVSYDATSGSRLWVRRYDGPAHGNDLAQAVVGSADGSRVFVTGGSDDGTGTADFATVAYRGTTGARLWSARYGTRDSELASAAAAATDGSAVFITGAVTTAASGQDFTTIAYDGATGSRRWVRRYAGPGLSFDTGESIAVNAASTTVYVTGRAVPDPAMDVSVATFAYDASTGSTVWSRFFTRVSGWGWSIDLSPDGSKVFVCGFVTEPPDDFTDAIALAYAA
jgi:WD40 repeat protein